MADKPTRKKLSLLYEYAAGAECVRRAGTVQFFAFLYEVPVGGTVEVGDTLHFHSDAPKLGF
jgi:hypothetical protein